MGISLFIDLFKVIKTFLDESVKFWHSGCAKCTFMLIIYIFLWILIWQSLSHFNCVLFCEVYVTEWKNNSFYCFSYELIYKLKLKIFTRVINKQFFIISWRELSIFYTVFFLSKTLNKELEFHFFVFLLNLSSRCFIN